MDPALPTSWETLPLPEQREPLGFESTYTTEEAESMALGLVPQQMEDKWFIYAKGDQLYFHRSWTGACIFWLRFEGAPEGYRVVESWVNRDPGQYRETDTAYDRAMLSFLIDAMLLGKSGSFPLRADHSSTPGGVYQHHVTGTAYPEKPYPYTPPKEGEPSTANAKQPLPPPITLVRLFTALVLVTIAWAGAWLKVREGMALGFVITMFSFGVASWVMNPAVKTWNAPVKPRHLFWIVIVSAGISLMISLNEWKPPLWFTEAIIHPVALVLCWFLNCGGLVFAWWKRRNNPPLQPESRAEVPSVSNETGSLPYE